MNHSEQFSAFSRPKADPSCRRNTPATEKSFPQHTNHNLNGAGSHRMSLDFLLNENNNHNNTHNNNTYTCERGEPASVYIHRQTTLPGICIPQPILPKPPQLGTTLPTLLPMVPHRFTPAAALYTTTTTTTTTTTAPVTALPPQDVLTSTPQGSFTSHSTSMLGKRKQQDILPATTTATRSTRVESPSFRFHYETSHRYSPIQSTSKTTLAVSCENPVLADTTPASTTTSTTSNKKIKLSPEKKEKESKNDKRKIKRETDSISEEDDDESDDSKDKKQEDEGEGGKVKKRRRRLTTHELFVLESYFAANNSPDAFDKVKLASALNMTPQQINNWFQNKRSRVRRDKQSGQQSSVQAAAALQAFGLLAGLTAPNSRTS